MPVNDAHVHVGYFSRKGHAEPWYYSPQRIYGTLTRCGIEEFIFSSTDGFAGIGPREIYREAAEMKRLAGKRAHAFFWVSETALREDPELTTLPEWYEGLKLHGGEYPWLDHPDQLRRLLEIARERGMAVQIHTGDDTNRISDYLPYCRDFPEVRFDLAHGSPKNEAASACRECGNIWFDLAFGSPELLGFLLEQGVPEDRLMFGSDIPAPMNYFENLSLTGYLRKEVKRYTSDDFLRNSMKGFLKR